MNEFEIKNFLKKPRGMHLGWKAWVALQLLMYRQQEVVKLLVCMDRRVVGGLTNMDLLRRVQRYLLFIGEFFGGH